MPTKEQIERMKKAKESLATNLEGIDIFSKFKAFCAIKGITIRQGLREAIIFYMEKEK